MLRRSLSSLILLIVIAHPVASQESQDEESLREAWIGKLQMGPLQPVMQFRIVNSAADTQRAYFDSITEGLTGFEASWAKEGGQLKFDVARIKLTYRGTLNAAGDVAEGTWSQGGRDLPLILKKQLTAYDNENVWENRPQRPTGPFPYDAHEVTFDNVIDGVSLAGTLTIPRGPGQHPAVVLISGSGPQDRDETLMEHKPFLVLADYLTRRGVAVLRYDDRGTGSSTGNFADATTADFANDAAAAVEFLTAHERIDANAIGLAGHSEGGLVAPMVVSLRQDIGFVVLMAATGVDGRAISISQAESMSRAMGADDEGVALELAITRLAVDIAINAEPDADIRADLAEALEQVIETIPEDERPTAGKRIRESIGMLESRLQTPWMRFFLTYDPQPALRQIKCPVLAIIGSKDTQVIPALNLPEIEKALKEGGNPDYELVELPGLNHLFQACETGAMSEYASIQETFNPAALEKIGDWIVERTTAIKR